MYKKLHDFSIAHENVHRRDLSLTLTIKELTRVCVCARAHLPYLQVENRSLPDLTPSSSFQKDSKCLDAPTYTITLFIGVN
jgi:hypothetical protein